MTESTLATLFRTFILDQDAAALKTALAEQHPADIAHALEEQEAATIRRILRPLPERQQADIFEYLVPETQVETARGLARGDLARIMMAMSHDERADLFNRLSPEQQRVILPGIAHAERDDIRRLAAYPEGTAGSIMTSDYATLTEDLSVRDAIARLRAESPDRETIYNAYVIDAGRTIQGVVTLRDLIIADDTVKVGDIMTREVISADVETSREDAARLIARYDLHALPIVNGDAMLVGIVTADDAMDVQEEAATRGFRRIGGVQDSFPHKGPGLPIVRDLRTAGIWVLYRMRIFWLVLLVFGNIFSGAGIAYFEDTIMAYVVLVFFLPLLIDSGGNAGSQAATLMVRALATGDVILKDWGRMIGKEVLVAGLLGLTMAVAVSAIGIFRGGPDIALVVSTSMVVIVLVGSVIGMSLPFLLSRFRIDPASASAPLITSIADTAGVLIYFFIATTFLPIPGV